MDRSRSNYTNIPSSNIRQHAIPSNVDKSSHGSRHLVKGKHYHQKNWKSQTKNWHHWGVGLRVLEDFVCYTFVIEKNVLSCACITETSSIFQKNSSLSVAGHLDNPDQKFRTLE